MTKTKTEYRNYIASEAWQQRRKRFLRTHDSCNRCGISRKQASSAYDQDLNVHHQNYLHVGAELDEDLEPLCKHCHEVESHGESTLPYIGHECWQCFAQGVPLKGEMCARCIAFLLEMSPGMYFDEEADCWKSPAESSDTSTVKTRQDESNIWGF